jgi:hypothetical protein
LNQELCFQVWQFHRCVSDNDDHSLMLSVKIEMDRLSPCAGESLSKS